MKKISIVPIIWIVSNVVTVVFNGSAIMCSLRKNNKQKKNKQKQNRQKRFKNPFYKSSISSFSEKFFW